jgi:galactokinase
MSELLPALEAAFNSRYGCAPQHVVRAPGRVNLIGEHTDYNDGFVLPCAVHYHTLIGIHPREEAIVDVTALDWGAESDQFTLAGPIASLESKPWANYVRGVFAELLARGYSLRGCTIAITGNVPQGAGLSSSAALEVGLVKALSELNGLQLGLEEIAAIGQAAENNFVGCACGIMDQLISATGREGYAIAIDCRSLALKPLPIPRALALLIVNSNVQRGLVDSEYNLRRAQCEEAAAHFGKSSLRDVSLAAFDSGLSGLNPVAARRAKHVLEENQRVLDMAQAFESEDIPRIGQLMAQSHRSMRDLFEITTPEIDALVDIVQRVIGERGGVRMTGGGFGGCVVALLPEDLIEPVQTAIADEYEVATGLKETVYLSRPQAGVQLIY